MAKGDAWSMEWSAVFFSFLICSFLDASCGRHFFVIHLSSLNDFE